MVMSWHDLLELSAITTKYKIAMPDVFKSKDLGWFDVLPPNPLVVRVHLPEEIVKHTEFVFWKLANPTVAVGQPDIVTYWDVANTAYPGDDEVDTDAIEANAKEGCSDKDDDTSAALSELDEVAVAGPGQDSTATPGLYDDNADDDAEEDSGDYDVKVETQPDSSPPASPK